MEDDKEQGPHHVVSTTPYRISTITALGNLGTLNLDIGRLHAALTVPYTLPEMDAHLYQAVLVDANGRKTIKGTSPFPFVKKKRSSGKTFDNQITCVLRVPSHEHRSHKPQQQQQKPSYSVNAKIFSNGNVQMSGLKTIEQGRRALHVISCLVQSASSCNEENHVDGVNNFRVCLINSDYKIGWDVQRERLFRVLTRDLGVLCGFEPCIYPGVKLQYAWNNGVPHAKERKGTRDEGVCTCSLPCSGKNRGDGDGKCRRITIAVFRSGCIIVTGAHTYEQLDDAYAFIRRVMEKNRPYIENVPYDRVEVGDK